MKYKFEFHLDKYIQYKQKADIELQKAIELLSIHTAIFPNTLICNDFGGDGIGIYPEHMQDVYGTYVGIDKVIQALRNGVIVDEDWFIENRCL